MNAFESAFSTSAYDPNAVQNALANKNPNSEGFAIIRTIVAIANKDLSALENEMANPILKKAVGYVACQRDTACLILAKWKNDQALFQNYLAEWKNGQKKYPTNYITDFLLWDGFKPWIIEADIVVPKTNTQKPRKIAPKLIQNPAEAICRAIHDNMQWLKETDSNADEVTLSKSYYFVEENKSMKEAVIHANDELPEIVISFDKLGNYLGSFLMH